MYYSFYIAMFIWQQCLDGNAPFFYAMYKYNVTERGEVTPGLTLVPDYL